MKGITIGSAVTYTDREGAQHDALITARHDNPATHDQPIPPTATINLVVVSSDPDARDQYGRQVVRESSVQGQATGHAAHGFHWRPVGAELV